MVVDLMDYSGEPLEFHEDVIGKPRLIKKLFYLLKGIFENLCIDHSGVNRNRIFARSCPIKDKTKFTVRAPLDEAIEVEEMSKIYL